jgi:hypothetical protein
MSFIKDLLITANGLSGKKKLWQNRTNPFIKRIGTFPIINQSQ